MWFRNFLLLLLIAFIPKNLLGQFIYTKQYTYENGLPTNEILSIYKDSRNLLWVGSRFGVIVKDMESFTLMKRFEKIQLNNISTITEDKNHNMWFGSYGQGLVKFSGQKYELYNTAKGLVSDRVRKLYIDNDVMHIGTQGGVSILDLKSNKLYNPSFEKNNNVVLEALTFFKFKNKTFVATIDHGVFEVTRDKLIFVNNFNRLINCFLYQNKLYFSTYSGFYEINVADFFAKKNTYQKIDIPNVRDQSIYKKRHSLITSAYDNNSGNGMIAEFKHNQFFNQTNNFQITSEYPSEFYIDQSRDVIYFGSFDKGISEVHLNHFLNFSTIDNKKVIEIFRSNNQDYFLTPLGLYEENNSKYSLKISREKFYSFVQKNRSKYEGFINQKNKDFQEINYNLKENELRFYRVVKALNSFWISSNLGLFEIDLYANLLNYLPIRPFHFAYYNNQFVVANSTNGVAIIDDIYQLSYTKYPDSQGNVPKDVVSICNNDKAVFFGSSLDGLFKYENGKFISYLQTNQFKESKLRMIQCIGKDKLMVATELSKVYLLQIDGDKLHKLKELDIRKVGGDNISFIHVYGGKIVIGTNRNLLIFDEDKMFTINSNLGFVNKNISASFFDGQYLTLGVENGLYKFNFNQFIQQPRKKEILKVTGLKINDEQYGYDKFLWFDLINKNLDLKNDENNLFLDFSIIDTEFPLNYKYRYRLNPDEKWSETFTDEFIYFRNLNHGKYKVQLEITNTINGEKQLVDLISLNIKPPFYLNIYFILFSITTLGLLIYKYYSTKIKTINVINELKINQLNEKSKQENKRLSLERQITETRLVALQSQMNPHFIFNVLNSIQYYILDNDVDNALNSLGRFSHLIRQMLNMSTKNEVSLNEEIDFLKLYVEVENFRWKNKIDFQINVDQFVNLYTLKIPPMLIQPILENAFVHAFDQNFNDPIIEINFSEDNDNVQIVVKDNGKGMVKKEDSNTIHESKALKIIDERLSLLNDNNGPNITINSSDNGTKVTMVLRIK